MSAPKVYADFQNLDDFNRRTKAILTTREAVLLRRYPSAQEAIRAMEEKMKHPQADDLAEPEM